MKWYWFCPCGRNFGEVKDNEDFCLVNCPVCNKTQIRAFKNNKYSLREKLKALFLGISLPYYCIQSISEEEENDRWNFKYVNGEDI